MKLEIIARASSGPRRGPPLVFVHGAFVGAWCWDEYFLPHFAQSGFDARAVSLRGHGGSPDGGALDLIGIDDYVADVEIATSGFSEAPVIIGHSMGAIVVQRAARRCRARAMVLIAPVPPQGLATCLFSLAMRHPPLFAALNAMQLGRADAVALRGVRDYLFSQSVTEADARRHLFRMQRESQRALADLAWPQHLWIQPSVGLPTLVLGAARDAYFPPPLIEESARFHGVAPVMFAGMAHAMMLEPAWRAVADAIVDWLSELPAQRPA